jgi:hypothetical protein
MYLGTNGVAVPIMNRIQPSDGSVVDAGWAATQLFIIAAVFLISAVSVIGITILYRQHRRSLLLSASGKSVYRGRQPPHVDRNVSGLRLK